MAVIPAHDQAEIVAFPPFDATTFGSQLFWLAIVFGTLYWFVSRIVTPRIGGIIEERRARIAKDLEDASAMQAKAQQAGEAYEKSLADARGSAQKIAQDMRGKLAAESEAKRKSIEGDLATSLAASEKRIADMKTTALANVESIATEAATAIVEKLGGRVDAAAASSAVKAALAR